MILEEKLYGVIFLFLTVFSSVYCKQLKPHIIVILADDLGWNDVSFHGADQIPTPNIDALAYNGIILNSHYSEPICTPSRAAFLTGKYPIHTGMQHSVLKEAEPRGLPLEEKLMPEYLREAGYVTHAIGKWHLGYYKNEYTPLFRGFDSHYGFYNGMQDYFSHIVIASTNTSWRGYDMRRNLEIDYDAAGKYSTTVFTEEAVKVIQKHDNNKPMFMYLAHLASHAGNRVNPLQAPDEEIVKFAHIPNPERRVYAAMVSMLDQSVGKVIAALREKRMMENSIILFMSDNGAGTWSVYPNNGSNYPLRGQKGSPWEGGCRVPAAIWSPHFQTTQFVSENLMHITDWLPTFLTAAGTSLHNLKNIDGIDQWQALTQNEISPRTEMLYNIDDDFNYAAIRLNEWKYILSSFFNGTQDKWYGDSGLGSEYKYDPNDVLKCPAGVSFTGFITDQQIKERREQGDIKRNNFTCKLLTLEKIWELRNESKIVCKKAKHEMIKCNPLESACLFNIQEDPCEQVNLALKYPKVLQDLKHMLKKMRKFLIPASNLPNDPNADPAKWNNTWVSWLNCNVIQWKMESLIPEAVLELLSMILFIVIVVSVILVKLRNGKK